MSKYVLRDADTDGLIGEAAQALEGECEPTHISELWMITRAARP